MGAGALGTSQNRAQIMGVGKIVAEHQQRRFSPGRSLGKDLVNGAVVPGGSLGDHALMGVGKGHGIQLPAIHRNHNGTGFLCLRRKALQSPVGLTVGNKNLINGTPAFQRFLKGVAPFQLAFRLLRSGGRGPSFIVHGNFISQCVFSDIIADSGTFHKYFLYPAVRNGIFRAK